MKKLLPLLLIFLLCCSPSYSDVNFPFQQNCQAEDLKAWTINSNSAIENIQLPITRCGKQDEIIVDGNVNGVLSLVKDFTVPKPAVMALIGNFVSNCNNATVNLSINAMGETFSANGKIQAVRIGVRNTAAVAAVTINTYEPCRVKLSALVTEE